MSKYATVWVFSDNQSRLAEVIGGARALGENVQAVVQGEAQAVQAFRLGADAVHDLGSLPAERIVESYADTLAHAIRSHGDRALVLLPATRSGRASALAFVAPAKEIACVSRRAKQGESVDLGKARWVVSVGRGIGSQQNIALAQAFSDAIGAELGCSRLVAEKEKWMERERYVGISGIMIKPELYLALGTSGQIQHMVGANGAQTIMAINKDKNTPIFQYADYGIVGDLTKIVPALTEALKR